MNSNVTPPSITFHRIELRGRLLAEWFRGSWAYEVSVGRLHLYRVHKEEPNSFGRRYLVRWF